MQVVCSSCGARNRIPEGRLRDEPNCGRCGSALLDPLPFALDDRSFDRYVSGTDLPVVVDCWAAWCGPCQAMAPQFEAAARQAPDVRFAKLDTDASPRVSAQLGIRSIPTLVLFSGGREVARRSGALSAADIVRWIGSELP